MNKRPLIKVKTKDNKVNARERRSAPMDMLLMERALVIFLEFTRRTGYRHPHLDDAIENYRGLLMEMGYRRDKINERLKELAGEIFESKKKEVKEE